MSNRNPANRNPSANPTPLDRASFYIESLKYGAGPGKVERAGVEQATGELEILLREAGVTSMTGAELLDAMEFYAVSQSRAFGIPTVLTRSLFFDGLMHGIAFAAGLEGEHRAPRTWAHP